MAEESDFPHLKLDQLPTPRRRLKELLAKTLDTLAEKRRRRHKHTAAERKELERKVAAYNKRQQTKRGERCTLTTEMPTMPSTKSAKGFNLDHSSTEHATNGSVKEKAPALLEPPPAMDNA